MKHEVEAVGLQAIGEQAPEGAMDASRQRLSPVGTVPALRVRTGLRAGGLDFVEIYNADKGSH